MISTRSPLFRTLGLAALVFAEASIGSPFSSVSAQSAKEKPPAGDKTQEKDKEKAKDAAPEDKTYRSKSAKFQITAPADKAWDFLVDEASRKQFLIPVYTNRCVTFFHDIAGKKDMVEVSVTVIDKKDTDFEKLVNLYRGNIEDHFADTLVFEVSDKAKFKGKKATSFKVEGRLKATEGAVLLLESYIFDHKEHFLMYEVATDSPATRDKYKKELGDIEKSLKFT